MRATGFLLLVVHLLIVGWLMLRPRTVPWVPAANLQPLASIDAELARGGWAAVWHLGGPLLLLAPLGVLLPLAGGRLNVSPLGSVARTVFGGAMISLAIELVQTAVPGQVPDVDAVLLNTLGVALAHLAVVPAARSRLRRRNDRLGGATPRIPRVGLAPQADVFPVGRTYF
ncbi:VanZ family protein [Streptomyces rhizoryzae]|uniref:VanZ family protein n=1 Tax=Streptomyces rhizoryzae TaxID=2932493 RepID=UPI00249F71DE|nr:VanZ family protein [Streptomyces rhizoryzae]